MTNKTNHLADDESLGVALRDWDRQWQQQPALDPRRAADGVVRRWRRRRTHRAIRNGVGIAVSAAAVWWVAAMIGPHEARSPAVPSVASALRPPVATEEARPIDGRAAIDVEIEELRLQLATARYLQQLRGERDARLEDMRRAGRTVSN